MLQLVRLVTVHPALVHFTIGGLPICVLAYLVAAGSRSERFTLAGDLALFLTTAITLVVFAFGLVSNAVLDWPGGLDFWRWMHLGFGAASTGLLVILSLGRAVQLRRGVKIVRWPLALGSAFTLALVLFTGWIGGEALVFTGGMAVLGAGNGALGPTLHYAKKPPGDVMKAMGQVRGDFGQIQTFTAQMIVTAPSAKDFATVAAGARHLAFIADGMAAGAVQPPRSAEQPPGTFELVHEMHGSQTALKKMSLELAERARAVEQAAQGQDLMALVGATTALEQSCVDCHQELRWHGHGQSASR